MFVDSVELTIARQGSMAKLWVQANPGRMVMLTQAKLDELIAELVQMAAQLRAANACDSNFYALLGLDRHATAKDIRAAYRRLSRAYHPDVSPGNTGAASIHR